MATATTSACADCWKQAANGHPPVHDACLTAIRAERRAARRFWIRINPAGCVTGSVYPSALKTDTTDGAHKEFTPRAADRRRETAEGWRHERVDGDEWNRRAKPCFTGHCRHRATA